MDLRKKIRGIIGSIFQLGLGGPQIKNNSGVIEMRNAADSDYVRLKTLAPVDDNDVVNKKYADTLSKPIITKRQADTSASIPTNTAVRGFLVVTTAGSGAVIGDVLFDDGSSSGLMEILAANEGRTLAITDSLSGGTITFDPDSIYQWDEDNTVWVKIGDIGSVTGAIRTVRFTIDNSAQQDSTFAIPANARILECVLEITTQYSGGTDIDIGNTSTVNLIMDQGDNNPQQGGVPNSFSIEQDTDWGGSDSVVRVTITGGPAAGAGVVIVKFTTPLA